LFLKITLHFLHTFSLVLCRHQHIATGNCSFCAVPTAVESRGRWGV